MANSIRLEIMNLDEVRRAIEGKAMEAAQVMDQAVAAAAEVVEAAAAAKAPGPGIGTSRVSEAVYEVGPLAAKWYYVFFETGTSAHLVLPRAKKALKWGEQYAASSHPGGIAAEPFLRPAVDENVDKAGAAAGEVIRAAIE